MEQESLFSENEIEVLETPESRIAKEANLIFKRWYVQWYKDGEGNVRYTQPTGFIIKELKKCLTNKVDAYELEWASNILGQESKPINDLNLQVALARVRRLLALEGNTIVASSEKEYGETL